MSVYVDPLMNCERHAKWRWSQGCHLFADTVEELHAFAQRIGLKRAWFQTPERFPHYDLNANRRKAAVLAGAVELHGPALLAKLRELRVKGVPR